MRWHGRFLSLCYLQACFTLGVCRLMGAEAKSKVLTGAPSYALAWMISDPMHSCATVCALFWLGSPLARVSHRALKHSSLLACTFSHPVHSCKRALQQKVNW
jgi:hypothetical protein